MSYFSDAVWSSDLVPMCNTTKSLLMSHQFTGQAIMSQKVHNTPDTMGPINFILSINVQIYIKVASWLIDFNFVYWRYPAKLLIPVVDVPTSSERKWNIHVYDTALQPIYQRDVILMSLVLVHAGYLFCNWHPLNTNYYGTIFSGMPGSFNSSQINLSFDTDDDNLKITSRQMFRKKNKQFIFFVFMDLLYNTLWLYVLTFIGVVCRYACGKNGKISNAMFLICYLGCTFFVFHTILNQIRHLFVSKLL